MDVITGLFIIYIYIYIYIYLYLISAIYQNKKLSGKVGSNMFTYALAAKLFESFSILRWNDRIRPVELVEIDHHALKSVLTYFLANEAEQDKKSLERRKAEQDNKPLNWRKIVDGNVFDLMCKISTSDIRADIRASLNVSLNNMIFSDWDKKSIGLFDKIKDGFKEYSNMDATLNGTESSILTFSHKYVTQSEFEIIKRFNSDSLDLKKIQDSINKKLYQSQFQSLIGVTDFYSQEEGGLFSLFQLIENLRYQTRWSQTPRIPLTSVLGHCMYTAVLVYFISVECGLEDERIVNNFYAALFHDLPEALTRDIISPVKNADPIIRDKIAEIEKERCEEKVFNRIPEKWRNKMRFITGQLEKKEDENWVCLFPDVEDQKEEYRKHGEFSNRVLFDDGKCQLIQWGIEGGDEYIEPMDEFVNEKTAVDGKIIKLCDNLSAFMEARMSIQHGIRSPHLEKGVYNTESACKVKEVYKLKIDDFFDSIVF